MLLPTRFVNVHEAQSQFGLHRSQRLGHFLNEGDEIGDAASRDLAALKPSDRYAALSWQQPREVGFDSRVQSAQSIQRLLENARTLPLWIDSARCKKGGEVILRAGLLSGLVLGLKSLICGYCSPAGNKPLILTGRLESDIPQRLHDTARFVQAICETGIEPGSKGFHAALHVRLIHSRVRLALVDSEKWNTPAWGTPINQYDMAGTILLFSYVLVAGIEQLGMHCTAEEKEDVIHLWRSVGHVMGVNHELLSTSWSEAKTLWLMFETTQALPDADARRLATALIEAPLRDAKTPTQISLTKQWVKIAYQASRVLIGHRYADALGYPKASLVSPVRILKTLMTQAEWVRRFIPAVDGATLSVGRRYWLRATRQLNVADKGRVNVDVN